MTQMMFLLEFLLMLELLEELAFKFVEFQAASTVVYSEVRYSPHEFFEEQYKAEPPPGMAIKVVEAVSCGLRRGEVTFGVVARQLLCCINFCPHWSMDVVQTAAAAREVRPLVLNPCTFPII